VHTSYAVKFMTVWTSRNKASLISTKCWIWTHNMLMQRMRGLHSRTKQETSCRQLRTTDLLCSWILNLLNQHPLLRISKLKTSWVATTLQRCSARKWKWWSSIKRSTKISYCSRQAAPNNKPAFPTCKVIRIWISKTEFRSIQKGDVCRHLSRSWLRVESCHQRATSNQSVQ